MTLREAFVDGYEHCIAKNRRCTQACIVDYVMQAHPELFWRDSQRLIRKAALQEVKRFMRGIEPETSEEDLSSSNQMDLPLGILPGLKTPRASAHMTQDTCGKQVLPSRC